MNETNSPHVYTAICRVIYDMSREGISKDRKNAQQGYSFRGIDDVYSALSPMLARNKLCILPRVIKREQVERQTAKGGALFYTTVHVEFDFVSAEDGSKHTIATVGEAMDSADKSSNKAMSAAFKYAAMQAFCIPTEGDNDADATTHELAKMIAPPAMPESELTDCLTALNDADDLESLKGIFGGAWKRATTEQKARLQKKYDERKAALSVARIKDEASAVDTY